MTGFHSRIAAAVFGAAMLGVAARAGADGGVTLSPVDDAAVASYSRAPSATAAERAAQLQSSLVTPVSIAQTLSWPTASSGLPGVAIFDYDRDGDLDIYVTNGPGAANALLQNQLAQTGAATFVDVAAAAGVAAVDQDSTGVCFGDTDNDGDEDLFVLGRSEANRFFENVGGGAFLDRGGAGAAGADKASASCAFADVDNDGLIDLIVANAFDFQDSFALFTAPYALNQHNQLFHNDGANFFSDISVASGIVNNGGIFAGRPGLTWSLAAGDVDNDGDADILFADDQGAVIPENVNCAAIPPGPFPCVDRSYVHVFIIDGAGRFTDRPMIEGDPFAASQWMGLELGDVNCDGVLDVFATSFGDYAWPALGRAFYVKGSSASRWFIGNGDGTFADPGVGALNATPFGWGAGANDYDNDGDLDLIYHGGFSTAVLSILDNPGAVLQNQSCSGAFVADTAAIAAPHTGRAVRGVAVGDLDRNGFVDVVTAANFRKNPAAPLAPGAIQYGSAFDATAARSPVMVPASPGPPPLFRWNGLADLQGDLRVELNGGANGNGSVTVKVFGTKGLTAAGSVNRSGIGAMVSVTPLNGAAQMQTVSGGSSHLSEHALEKVFGLGTAHYGRVDIAWPGGVRNRLYGVKRGEQLSFPEIPCDYTAAWKNFGAYVSCVSRSLADLRRSGAISGAERTRFASSALLAYWDHRRPN